MYPSCFGRRKSHILFFVILTGAMLAFLTVGCAMIEGKSVNSYLRSVESIQHDSDQALQDLTSDLADLNAEPAKVQAAVVRLREKKEAVQSARGRIEGLEAPEPVGNLRADLLTIYDKGGNLLEQLALTGEYRLAMEPLEARYENASSDFSKEISGAKTQDEILACVRNYQAAAAGIHQDASKLSAPLLSQLSHQRFVGNLGLLNQGLLGMVSGLENDDPGVTQSASDRLQAISGGNTNLRQQIAADRQADIRSYNAQIQEILSLAEKIRQDQAELHQEFDRN